MTLIAFGLNHQTAPLSLREQVAFAREVTPYALSQLMKQPGVEEALILSTCNRTELYCTVTDGAEQNPQHWWVQHHGLATQTLEGFVYRHDEAFAVRHLFRVATGLDSMVLGEPQILGQVKEAYQIARAAHTLRAPLERLMQQTFAVAKRIRTETNIGARSVSVAYTAVRLAERVFADLKHACVLLIGAGEMIDLAAKHLFDSKVKRLIIANRTLENAHLLASRYAGYATTLADIPQHLAEADIVIACTSSLEPIITRTMVESAIRARRHRPMFLVDIAVPRDIEASVGELEDVFLYTIDDLKQVIDDNLRFRQQAASEAETIIELYTERYLAWRRGLLQEQNPLPILRRIAENQRDEVLAKAQHLLQTGRSPEQALEFLAHTLTNKLLHTPSATLRQAAQQGDGELLQAAERLFGYIEKDKRDTEI